jgi:hypothetical protein
MTINARHFATTQVQSSESELTLFAHYTFDAQDMTDETGNYDGSQLGVNPITYSNAEVFVVGDPSNYHAVVTTNRGVSLPQMNLGDEFTVVSYQTVERSYTSRQITFSNYAGNDGIELGISRGANSILDTIYATTGNGTNILNAQATPTDYTDQQVLHLIWVVDRTSGTITIYQDGVDVSNTTSARTDFENNAASGALFNSPSQGFNFRSDCTDIKIYTGLFTQSNATNQYNNPFTTL